MKKCLIVGAALAVFAGQAMGASVRYEILEQRNTSSGIVDGPVLIDVEFDLDLLPFSLSDIELRFNVSSFIESLVVTDNGVSTRYEDPFSDLTNFDWFTANRLGTAFLDGPIRLSLDTVGDVTAFSYDLTDGLAIGVKGDQNGCRTTDFDSGFVETCALPPIARRTGDLPTATTAAVPLPLPGLMLGAGLLGFMGLRRKVAA